jgi:predicted DNA-binding transcriptional regulator AlpA
MSRDESARYIGVGVTKFDEMVLDGRMPKPKRIDGRVVWDRIKVDAAFTELPDDVRTNPLDHMLGGLLPACKS